MKDLSLERFAEFGLRFPLVPASEGYVTSNDCRISFSLFGEGRPVLLLHGGMGNSTNWSLQIEGLVAKGYRVVVMDTRAHGRSTAGTQTLGYRVFAQDVRCLIRFLDLKEVTLVGWSDGACTALELARTDPADLSGVIFFACNVDPSGTHEFKMTETIQNCVTRHELDFCRMTPTQERFADLQPKLAPMQTNEPNYHLDDLGNIFVPVAVLQAENDEFIKRDHARYLADALPNSSYEVLKGVSHFAPIQHPSRFNKALLKCLRRFKKGATSTRGSRSGSPRLALPL